MFPRFPESRGPELPPGGHGLQGMQTRVGMLGGDFDAGRAQVAGSAYRPACRCAIRPVSRWKARPLVRTGFRLIIAEADDIEVVGEAGDGAEAVRVTAAAHPDVVLMDIRMPVGAADILKHPAHGVRSGITLTTQQLHGVQRDDQAGQGVGHDVMNVPGQPGALGERRGPIPGLLGPPVTAYRQTSLAV